jgi:hypothetical protein
VTQTERTRTQSAYLGVVYGADLLDHASVMAGTPRIVPNDYVGQTRQRGRARENQHRDDKPWSDLIVGSTHILWEGVCTDTELNDRERYFIREVEPRPRMNWKLNEDNPEQIPKWTQLEQRHQRDDRAGRPRWQPPESRSRQSLLDWEAREPARVATARRKSITSWWTPNRIKEGIWSASWIGTGAITWVNLDDVTLWQPRLGVSAAVGLLLVGWVRAGMPVTKAQRRRVRGRIRRGGLRKWRRW